VIIEHTCLSILQPRQVGFIWKRKTKLHKMELVHKKICVHIMSNTTSHGQLLYTEHDHTFMSH